MHAIDIQTDVLIIGTAQAPDGIAVGDVDGTCETSRESIRHSVDSGGGSQGSGIVRDMEWRVNCNNLSWLSGSNWL